MFWTWFSMVSFRADSSQYLNQFVLFQYFQLLIGVKLLQVLLNRRYTPNAGKFCIHTAFITEKGKTHWSRLAFVLTFLLIRWYTWLLSPVTTLLRSPVTTLLHSPITTLLHSPITTLLRSPITLYYVAPIPYYTVLPCSVPLLLPCSNPICSFWWNLDLSNLQFVLVGMDVSEFVGWCLVKVQLVLSYT